MAFPGGDLASLSWILNGYTVAFAALFAPTGRLADRYGRRRVFLIGVAVFTTGSAASALDTYLQDDGGPLRVVEDRTGAPVRVRVCAPDGTEVPLNELRVRPARRTRRRASATRA